MSDWPTFLKKAATNLTSEPVTTSALSMIDRHDYLMACEIVKASVRPEQWTEAVVSEFSQISDPSALHRAIAQLNPRIVVTTNFDKIIENNWAAVDSLVERYPAVITTLTADTFKIFRDDREYLIKIHGSIDDPDSLIFAKEDYSKRAFSNWIYNEFMHTLMLTHTFLFVGFSMEDPAISLLVEVFAQKYNSQRPHYIFLPSPVSTEVSEISKRLRKLYVITYDPKDGHSELPKLLTSLATQADVRRKELYAEAEA